MKSGRVENDVPASKVLPGFSNHERNEGQQVRDRAGSNAQGLSKENEPRVIEDVNGRRTDLVHVQSRPVIKWEQFLPLRSLKVLLVESDDSTRHVVAALLRNCSYEVTAVENGLEAWKILEDLTKHIDLVLTEVVMPHLTGVGLLSKIMSHITRKNIPVIMMSADDSMGIVFNCLSKGAVDFLVKPVRKNELKNLWQHVWRKCHSSSGSGSESGIRTWNYTKSTSIGESDNNNGSNDEDDNMSIGLTSDSGSGTQGSWSRRVVEVDSPHATSWDQLPEPRDSTCAQVTHAMAEAFSKYSAHMNVFRTFTREENEQDTIAMGKDLEIGVPRNSSLSLEDPGNNMTLSAAAVNNDKYSGSNSKDNGETRNEELRTEAADPMHTIDDSYKETRAYQVPNDLSKNLENETVYCSKESPGLELSLKRPRDVAKTETCTREQIVLRHSGLSAFSRYNNGANASQALTGNVGSSSPVGNSSDAAIRLPTKKLKSTLNETPDQCPIGSSDDDDMGSTTNNNFTKFGALGDVATSVNPCSNFQSIDCYHTTSLLPVIPSTFDGETVNTVSTQQRAPHQQVQVRHLHHHYHHHHHHVHSLQQDHQMADLNDASLRNMESNVLTATTEGDAANYRSASGSNNKSNGVNASEGQPRREDNDSGAAGKCEGGDASGSGTGKGSGIDQNRLTQREAALIKFRQKKKGRSFEKKVRYLSRKKLAEQRPRVRGQFVRRGVDENKNEDADS